MERRGPKRWLLAVALVVVAVLGVAAPADAHAELVDTDPDQGAALDRMPEVVTLTFNEHVLAVPDGVRVYDAGGGELDSSATTRDDDLLVAIGEDDAEGTIVVAWRVVSLDGHPIVGTLSFSVGAPSADPVTPRQASAPRAVSTALSLMRWPFYVGLLLAVGLIWFLVLVAPAHLDASAGVRSRLRRTARAAASVSVLAWLLSLPLDALYLRGSGLSTLAEGSTWESLPLREVACVALLAVALLVGVVSRGALAAFSALGALVPVALVGHSIALTHPYMSVLVDVLHLAAAAAWFGGLVGLVMLSRGTSRRSDLFANAVRRFSSLAATVLAVLVVAGSVLAWQIVGSWQGLVESGYGQVLLAKLALGAVAVTIATYNRFCLLPDLPNGRPTLTRTITVEACVLAGVLLVTAFLVQKSPPTNVGSDLPPMARTATGTSDLGGLQATVRLDPAAVGTNTVTVEIDNSSGTPAELFNPPRLRVLGERADVGDVTIEPISLGTYQGTVVLPTTGTWRFQVSVRVDAFTNPVTTVQLDVR